MTSMPDLGPAARRMAGLLADVDDARLTAPTPSGGMSLGALVDHVSGLSLAFTWAAAKELPQEPSGPPSADAARLAPGWQARVTGRLDAMAAAWRSPESWQGTTQAGGIELPGAEAGLVALNELVVHGWDVSRALGRPYDAGEDEIEACLAFVAPSVERSGGKGVPGLFGPAVEVGAGASALDRLIAMTGRDPSWTADRF